MDDSIHATLIVPNPGENRLMKALVTTSLLLPASLLFACSSSKDEGASLDLYRPRRECRGRRGRHRRPCQRGHRSPTGFDNRTNGSSTQTAMDAARDTFSETE